MGRSREGLQLGQGPCPTEWEAWAGPEPGDKKQRGREEGEGQDPRPSLTSPGPPAGSKLAALEEFRLQKEELTEKFTQLEEQLHKQDSEYKEHIYNVEKKSMMDKDRWASPVRDRAAQDVPHCFFLPCALKNEK